MRYFLVTLCVTLVLLRDAFSQTTSPTTSATTGNTTGGTTPGTTAGATGAEGTTPGTTAGATGTEGTTPGTTAGATVTGGTTPSATTEAAGTAGITTVTTPAPSENTTAAPALTTTPQSAEAAMRDVQRKIAYSQFMIGKMDELMIKSCPSYPPTYVPEAMYNIARRRRQEEADDRQIEKLKLMQYLYKCLLDDLIDKYLDCKLSPTGFVIVYSAPDCLPPGDVTTTTTTTPAGHGGVECTRLSHVLCLASILACLLVSPAAVPQK